MMDLRPYQQDALNKINEKAQAGVNKQVLVLATGLGKTVVFSHLIKDRIRATGKRALVLAHREELLGQAKEKILAVDPSLNVELEQGIYYADHSRADVVVASTATIGRAGSRRIKEFDPLEYGTIIIDEAHHASASTYKNILLHFGVLKQEEPQSLFGPTDYNKDILLLGVTATPSRNDNEGIDKVFDEVVYNYGIIQGVKDGWLSRIKAYRVKTGTDITGVKRTAGDFNQKELEQAVNTDTRNGLIISSYRNLAAGQKALCFAVDVAHTQALTVEFNQQKIPATFITGDLDRDTRHERLEKFKKGEYRVMVNCMVLTEGFDESSIECVLMARPTQSGILYSQMIGRGTRLHPGKQALTIIDFVDNTFRQRLQTVASLMGIGSAIDFKGKDVFDVKDKLDSLNELAPNLDLENLDIDKIDRVIEEVDILSGLQIPSEVADYTTFEWYRYGEDTYRINLGEQNGSKKCITVTGTITGQYVVTGSAFNLEKKVWSYKELKEVSDLKEGIAYGDSVIEKYFPQAVRLVETDRAWREEPPSEKQLSLLRKFRVNENALQNCTKGQASRLITKLLNMSPKDRAMFGRATL